jgi:hypothetical protein
LSASELVGKSWLRNRLIPKLLTVFPEKKFEIERLKLIYEPPRSAANIKKAAKVQMDYRQAAGTLMHDMRKAYKLSIEAVDHQFKTRVLKGKLTKIEEGGNGLAGSIFCTGVREICSICKELAPKEAAPYLPLLEKIREHLRPR